jgi:hypothetical protein
MNASTHPLHKRYHSIKNTCINPNNVNYKYYGGRGITMCSHWQASFWNFANDIEALIGTMPTADHVLDRIDNDGDWEPGNVQWSTRIYNSNHKRNNHQVMFGGVLITIADLARQKNVNFKTLWSRIIDYGLTAEEAVQIPLYQIQKYHKQVNNTKDQYGAT